MKKILVIHNKYRLEGGEDIAIQNELKVLKKNFETRILYFDNEIESYVRQFFYFLFNKNNLSIKKFWQLLNLIIQIQFIYTTPGLKYLLEYLNH